MNIIALTCLAMDLYPDHNLEYVGGNAVNVATQCKRSGVADVAALGAIGTDAYGDAILHHLEFEGIDASHVYRLKGATATHQLYLTKGDRQEQPGLWQGGVYNLFRLSDKDWDFVNTYDIVAIGAFDPNFEEAMLRLAPQCKLVANFLDTRDFVHLEKHINRIAVAVMSGTRGDVARARALSSQHDTLILITLGEEGSAALFNGAEVFQPALPVAQVVDTTGCGDAFQAAFVVSWFHNHNLKQAMEAGADAAAKTLTHFGGV